MKKILCIMAVSVLFSLSIFADGEIGTGNKACTANSANNCLVNPDAQVETTKDTGTIKSITETANDYFGNIVKYFTDIAL
jgi:uncharacterized protein YdeI (BOF family)